MEQPEMPMDTIQAAEVAASPFCVAIEDGDRVHEALRAAINGDGRVRLSFRGVEEVTYGFLHAAYGQFLADHDRAWLAAHIELVDIQPQHRRTLEYVAERGVRYYADPERFARTERAALEADDY